MSLNSLSTSFQSDRGRFLKDVLNDCVTFWMFSPAGPFTSESSPNLNCTRATIKNTAPRKTTFRKNQNRIFAYNGNLIFMPRNPFPDQSACSLPNEASG